jgi:hypothetical protein
LYYEGILEGGLTLEKQAKAIIIILVLMVGVSGIYLTIINPLGTEFVVSLEEVASGSGIALIFNDLKDCDLNIQFVDSKSYTLVEIVTPSPMLQSQVFFLKDRGSDIFPFFFYSSVNSVNVTIGTRTYYHITYTGTDVTANITYSNGAVLNGQTIMCGANGTLYFTFTEDVTVLDEGMDVYDGARKPTMVYIYADLPAGLNGRIHAEQISFVENVGWNYRGDDVYSTSVSQWTQPLLSFSWVNTPVIASLLT